MDQNLLDKQLILETLLDLLEKNPNGFSSQSHQSAQQHLHQRTSSQLNNSFLPGSKNTLAFFEMSTIKLLLTSSKNLKSIILVSM